MSITLDIQCATNLASSQFESRVNISNLNCTSQEMPLAKYICDVVTKEVAEYRRKGADKNKGEQQ